MQITFPTIAHTLLLKAFLTSKNNLGRAGGGQTTLADVATTGPIFNDYGAAYDIRRLPVPLRKNYQYKVFLNTSKGPDSDEKFNHVIDNIARYINMHVRHGVKLENIDIAIILHGKATPNGLSHKAYEVTCLFIALFFRPMK